VFPDLRGDLRRAAHGDDARAEDDYEGILWQIVGILARTSVSTRAASAIGGRRMARGPASAFLRPRTNWRERRKLKRDHEKYIRRLRDHPLVRSFPLDELTFFAPDEVICPHGRPRKRCQGIRAGLELLRVRPFSEKGPSRTTLLQDFRRFRVRPDADPEGYCPPITRERWEEVPPLPPRPGRPREPLQADLLRTVGNDLLRAGLSRRTAVAYVARILKTCFAVSIAPASLERLGRRHKPRRTR
jgi:hypothetical protein